MLRRKMLAALPAAVGAALGSKEHRVPVAPTLPQGRPYHTDPEPRILVMWGDQDRWYEPLPNGRWSTRLYSFWGMWVAGHLIVSPFDVDLDGGREAAKHNLLASVHRHLSGWTALRPAQEYGVSLVQDGESLPKPMSWAPEGWRPRDYPKTLPPRT